ncbi:uncharacterized protein VTP21DRAFT_10984 [Calcarisporiella thermophila]|uniref:uncharacterized protein n=1 Tax=Calcarisporiella thermophila TaxID=911321 RepID=UPI003742447B
MLKEPRNSRECEKAESEREGEGGPGERPQLPLGPSRQRRGKKARCHLWASGRTPRRGGEQGESKYGTSVPISRAASETWLTRGASSGDDDFCEMDRDLPQRGERGQERPLLCRSPRLGRREQGRAGGCPCLAGSSRKTPLPAGTRGDPMPGISVWMHAM